MLAPDESRRLDDLITGACEDAPALAHSIAALGNHSPSVEALVDLSVPLSSASVSTEPGLRDLQKYRRRVAEDSGGAWMDNTSILTAVTLMSEAGPGAFTPLTLWDLVTFFDAVVGFDRIYHHAHPAIDDEELNRRLGGKMLFKPVPLPLQDPASPQILPDPWEGAHRFMCEVWEQGSSWLKVLAASSERPDTPYGDELKAVLDGWNLALGGLDLTAAEILDWRVIAEVWQSPSDLLLRQMAEVTDVGDIGAAVKPSLRGRLLTELNLRAYVNQRMADFFGLPYASGTARVPFRRHLYNRAIAVQHQLEAVGLLDRRYEEIAGEVRLRLPVFLAVAVRGAGRPSDLWEKLAKLRGEARPYREVRWEFDAALADMNKKEAKRLAKALNTSVDGVLKIAGKTVAGAGVAAVAEVAKTGDLTGLAGGIAALQSATADLLDSSAADRLLWRLRQPHLLWFNNITDQAERLTEALPTVAKLWRVPEIEKKRFVDRFHMMGELQQAG